VGGAVELEGRPRDGPRARPGAVVGGRSAEGHRLSGAKPQPLPTAANDEHTRHRATKGPGANMTNEEPTRAMGRRGSLGVPFNGIGRWTHSAAAKHCSGGRSLDAVGDAAGDASEVRAVVGCGPTGSEHTGGWPTPGLARNRVAQEPSGNQGKWEPTCFSSEGGLNRVPSGGEGMSGPKGPAPSPGGPGLILRRGGEPEHHVPGAGRAWPDREGDGAAGEATATGVVTGIEHDGPNGIPRDRRLNRRHCRIPKGAARPNMCSLSVSLSARWGVRVSPPPWDRQAVGVGGLEGRHDAAVVQDPRRQPRPAAQRHAPGRRIVGGG